MDTIVQRLQKRVHAQASSDAGIATANSKQSSTHAMHGNLSPVQLWIGASPNTRTGLLVQQRACAAKGMSYNPGCTALAIQACCSSAHQSSVQLLRGRQGRSK